MKPPSESYTVEDVAAAVSACSPSLAACACECLALPEFVDNWNRLRPEYPIKVNAPTSPMDILVDKSTGAPPVIWSPETRTRFFSVRRKPRSTASTEVGTALDRQCPLPAPESSENNQQKKENTVNKAINEIEINGVKYRPVTATANPGKRAVVVVDRGWIFAGDITENDGRIILDRAVWVFGWQSVGFASVVADPKKAKADIRPIPEGVNIPVDAEIFRVPVGDAWGL